MGENGGVTGESISMGSAIGSIVGWRGEGRCGIVGCSVMTEPGEDEDGSTEPWRRERHFGSRMLSVQVSMAPIEITWQYVRPF